MTLAPVLDARWLSWLSDVLVHSVWMGAAAALLAWAGLRATPRPAARHAIALAAFALLAMGLLVVAISSWPLSSGAPAGGLVIRPPAANLGIIDLPPGSAGMPLPVQVPLQTLPWWRLVAAWGWLAGLAFLSLRHCHGWWLVARLRHGTTAASAELVARVSALATRLGIRPPALCLQIRLQVPAVIGWWRPVILLPTALATGLSMDQLEALLLHELAHLRRQDWLIEILVGFIETLLFFHPAVGWLGRRLRADRERCCDALALDAGADSLGFARALLALAERATTPTPVLAASGGILAERIREILGLPRRPDGAARALVLILSLPVLLALATACCPLLVPTAPATTAPAGVAAEPGFSLQQRIRGRSSGLQMALELRAVEGPASALARCGLPVAGPAITRSGHERAVFEQALRDADDLRIIASPMITAFPLQRVNCAFMTQYSYIADYRFTKEHQPDPRISVLTFGQTWESCCDWEGLDPARPAGVRITALKVDQVDYLGSELFTFNHHRTGVPGNTDAMVPMTWEEPVCALRRATLPAALSLAPDALLLLPTTRTIQRQPAPIHGTVAPITGPEHPVDTHRGEDRALAILLTARLVAVPTPSFITYDATPAVWMELPITLEARDEPLGQVVTRLRPLLPVPITLAPDPEHAALRVSLSADHVPLRLVLERLLPQTLLQAHVTPTALRLQLDAIQDYPAKEMGPTGSTITARARQP